MHYCRSANERTEEAHHEIDGVIRRENTEITNARRERINRSERDALLEVIFVRHHAAFGATAGARGIDDARRVIPRARSEGCFARTAKLFPALSAAEFGIGGRLSHQNSLYFCCSRAAFGDAQLAPNGIFGDQNFRT